MIVIIAPECLFMKMDEAFLRGIAHFNAGQFFEAHEAWEQLWLVSAEPTKTFLQGMIQIAAAFHHYERGNFPGARSLLTAGFEKIQLRDSCEELLLTEFKTEIGDWVHFFASHERGTERVPPKIRIPEA